MAQVYKGIEIPDNDAERVEAVMTYGIVETPPEQVFDDITELAATVTGCPVAYISIFDDTRSWLKSSYGLPKDRPPRPRELSMCSPTICQTELLVVPDMTKHPRYASLPAVTNPPHARFYCAMPLINRDNYALGTLCAWSPDLIEADDALRDAMRRLARLTLDKLERRRDLLDAEKARRAMQEQLAGMRGLIERAEEVTFRLLPASMAMRLMSNAEVAPRLYEQVSVVAAEIVGFPATADARALPEAVETLKAYFDCIEPVVPEAGLERIGTSGATFLAVAGMPRTIADHAARATAAANAMLTAIAALNAGRAAQGLPCWQIRIGVHSGPVVCGITGDKRLNYNLWGDGIETAHTTLQAAETGTVRISEATAGLTGKGMGDL